MISVSKLCTINNVFVEFLPYCFFVKDLQTGSTLVKGKSAGGIYEWQASKLILAFSTQKATTSVWHNRLGHPASAILRHIISNNKLPITSFASDYRNSCLLNESHKQPFSTSSLTSSKPLEIIFSDVWSSLVVSCECFKYYVLFVDHHTKYIWFYPLKNKSEAKDVFIRFKAIVENYFKSPIQILYSDNGREYIALKFFFGNEWGHSSYNPSSRT